jgi:hypothetical protein
LAAAEPVKHSFCKPVRVWSSRAMSSTRVSRSAWKLAASSTSRSPGRAPGSRAGPEGAFQLLAVEALARRIELQHARQHAEGAVVVLRHQLREVIEEARRGTSA